MDYNIEDVRIDVFTAGSSVAVRAVHAPSGVVVSCSEKNGIARNKEAVIEQLRLAVEAL